MYSLLVGSAITLALAGVVAAIVVLILIASHFFKRSSTPRWIINCTWIPPLLFLAAATCMGLAEWLPYFHIIHVR